MDTEGKVYVELEPQVYADRKQNIQHWTDRTIETVKKIIEGVNSKQNNFEGSGCVIAQYGEGVSKCCYYSFWCFSCCCCDNPNNYIASDGRYLLTFDPQNLFVNVDDYARLTKKLKGTYPIDDGYYKGETFMIDFAQSAHAYGGWVVYFKLVKS